MVRAIVDVQYVVVVEYALEKVAIIKMIFLYYDHLLLAVVRKPQNLLSACFLGSDLRKKSKNNGREQIISWLEMVIIKFNLYLNKL